MEYLVSMSLWQLLFNILLTFPFGVYMRHYFNLSLKRTILYSFLLSLFYETSQLTALFGIYPGPYRLADVEDLICNTMGGVVGYYIAATFARVLPSRDEIDEMCRIKGTRVTGMRRIWATLFDYLCAGILNIFVIGALRWLTYAAPLSQLNAEVGVPLHRGVHGVPQCSRVDWLVHFDQHPDAKRIFLICRIEHPALGE